MFGIVRDDELVSLVGVKATLFVVVLDGGHFACQREEVPRTVYRNVLCGGVSFLPRGL